VKYLSWIVTLPLMAIAVIFAVQHRERVAVDLWPLPIQVEPPLYLLVLVGIFVGFLLGGLVVWVAQHRHRRLARDRRRRIGELERDLEQRARKIDSLRAQLRAQQTPDEGAGGTAPLGPERRLTQQPGAEA